MRTHGLWMALLLLPVGASAQQTLSTRTRLPFDAPESWAMKYFTSVSLLSGQGTPPPIAAGAVHLSLEVENVPFIGQRERTVGFGGTKEEDLNKVPVLVRPRLMIGLPAQLSLTVSIVPPIRVWGVQTSLFGLSVGRPLVDARGFSLGARIYGQLGSAEGDFTCPTKQAEAGQNPALNPFGCEAPSRDRIDMNSLGLELGGSYRIARAHGLTPHLLIAGNYLDNGFDVHARYAGAEDRTSLGTRGFTFSGAAGLSLPVTSFASAGLQVLFTPLTVRRPPALTSEINGLVHGRFYVDFKLL